MNKTAIKNFAIWARVNLIEAVKQRAFEYEITESGENNTNIESIGDRLLSIEEKEQRRQLLAQLQQKGFTQVMEEAAYTWFNRFIALRFMEVNGYLPSKIRVFTDENGAFKPEIMKEAMTIELEGLDKNKVLQLLDVQANEELYKYLLITQCNALNAGLPYMFERIANWTELLFPANLLRNDSVIGQMISSIPEEDWTDQVQIIGWLYQYYNSELKDETFALLKKNIKVTKERIPSATQLFTPDWIVRYMVENSLGRLWYEGHRDFDKSQWKYYLDEAKQEAEVEQKLEKLRAEYANIKPEEIKLIDPCMGSGHILVYAFDVLMQIYEANGYSQRDAAQSILKNNLYGLDIDDRAAQLAYFAVMMKARQYDRRIFSRGIQPRVYTIVESNALELSIMDYFTKRSPKLKKDLETLIDELHDAKEYGSILHISQVDFAALYARIDEVREDISIFREVVLNSYLPLIQVAEVMAQKYDVVVTNPPYMGAHNMSSKLSDYVKKHYPDSKSDLFAVFIERCSTMANKNGYQAMITQHSWMFLSSYERLRDKLLKKDTINMAHLGARAFEEIGGEVVQTTAFVRRNSKIDNYLGKYCRLVEPTTQQGKEELFLSTNHCPLYTRSQDNFSKIPGSPVAYWVSERFINAFTIGTLLGEIADSKQGLATADNNKFLREWYEVQYSRIKFNCKSLDEAKQSRHKWFPYNKGGEFRKWYGNNDFVINWENDGYEIKHFFGDNGKLRSRPQNLNFMFRSSSSWSDITSGTNAFRYKPAGHLFDITGMSFFTNNHTLYLLSLCNTKVVVEILKIVAPTIHCQCGDVANIPVIIDHEREQIVEEIARENIKTSKNNWDSFETSWDFKRNPLV